VCLGNLAFRPGERRCDGDRPGIGPRTLLDAFAEHGGNFIDTANGYGQGRSEEWIGEWLADRDREDFVVASKCYWSQVSRFQENLSRKNVRAEVEGSLDRLDTDYLDILYLHRFDDETPIERTLRTVDDLVSGEGSPRRALDGRRVEAHEGALEGRRRELRAFTVTQPLFHAAYYEDVAEYLDVCADQNLAVCPYSPLAGGFPDGRSTSAPVTARTNSTRPRTPVPPSTTGSWTSTSPERGWYVLDEVRAIADEVDATPAQIALRWLMDQPDFDCVPIVGARTVDHSTRTSAPSTSN